METNKIESWLKEYFNESLTAHRKRHLIFWYDDNGELEEEFEALELPGVRKWKVTEKNLFKTKYELEVVDPSSHFLLYSPMPKPAPRENWLLDLLKVGKEFTTDPVVVRMREVGVENESLRTTFEKYHYFFRSKERRQAFKKYPLEKQTVEVIERTILATITKSKTNTLDDIVKSLFKAIAKGNIAIWKEIEKYKVERSFWNLMHSNYGYFSTDQSIRSLLFSFFITYTTSNKLSLPLPEGWKEFICNRSGNIVVMMDKWMNHVDDRKYFRSISDNIAKEMNVYRHILAWDVDDIVQLDTFKVFDNEIIRYLINQLIHEITDFNQYQEIISVRKKKHWYDVFYHDYQAIYYGIEFFSLLHQHDYFIPEQSLPAMLELYKTAYYKIDTAYRKFYVHYDLSLNKEMLHPLKERLENMYHQEFINQLALKWTNRLEQEKQWKLPNVPQQSHFFKEWVLPFQNRKERIFVIISDALRYEVAHELFTKLNTERKGSTQIDCIQGVIPSFTALGMAALLPHKNIAYENNQVLVDGMRVSSTKERGNLLKTYDPEAIAVQYYDIPRERKKFRELFQKKSIIYIYHNVIDATGDNVHTERDVFQSAEQAIEEIKDLINRLVNNVSAANILIAADHGFLYQRERVAREQKVPFSVEEVLYKNRRSMITSKRYEIEGTLTFPMNEENNLYVTIPKGINRFSLPGKGINYVHGGAMVQEIAIPVITFKNVRSASSENDVTHVEVKLTSATRIITNEITYLTFVQTEKVEDKRRPIRLRLYLEDEKGERVSNENIIIADSTSSNPAERTYREKFVLREMDYDRSKTYYLVLAYDKEQIDKVYARYPFTIDIP